MIYALVVACAVVVTLAMHLSGDLMLRSRTKRRCLVTTDGGTWFAGVLLSHDRRSLVLVSATTEAEDGSTASVDGEVLILLDDVAHIQFP